MAASVSTPRMEAGGLELHLKHLVVVLQPVLDQQERFVSLAPVNGGQVLVGLVIPVDVGHVADLHARFGEVGEGEGVLLVGGDGGGPGLGGRQDGEVDVGQGDDGVPGQGAGVAAGRRPAWTGRRGSLMYHSGSGSSSVDCTSSARESGDHQKPS